MKLSYYYVHSSKIVLFLREKMLKIIFFFIHFHSILRLKLNYLNIQNNYSNL